ncbi:polyphosphate polymerase domain-containing protein [Crocinitomicaceae bacterium]|nr:polyphosphate polymerase domain-containing protein [Crocinitomicaceae bacterium]MDB3907530.1 polyphosphate polymerase domain-containing protein [Crocinitomicaceae bacterium]
MPTQHLDNIINAFDPIHLEEMNGTALMNRVDTKFVITLDQLIDVLPKLQEHYRILEIEGLRLPQYESEYYDSDSLDFYIDHHRKKVDRFKVRFRKYVESDLSFLEVKHKSKGRTDKRRIMVKDLPGTMNAEHAEFVNSTGVRQKKLNYILTNKFHRITLVGKNHVERLTFDLNLEFNGNDTTKMLNNLVIAELKQERLSRISPFYKIVKSMLIRPYRISKYCIGVIELYGRENVKYNRFKKKLLKLNKIQANVA